MERESVLCSNAHRDAMIKMAIRFWQMGQNAYKIRNNLVPQRRGIQHFNIRFGVFFFTAIWPKWMCKKLKAGHFSHIMLIAMRFGCKLCHERFAWPSTFAAVSWRQESAQFLSSLSWCYCAVCGVYVLFFLFIAFVLARRRSCSRPRCAHLMFASCNKDNFYDFNYSF